MPWKSASGCCSATAPIRACSRNASITFNVLAPNVQGAIDLYAALDFRLTEYAEEDRPSGHIAAAWMHRKGNVHDLAFTNASGPRLHHLAYWVPTPLQIIHLCDLMATTGYLANLERGPGRHGISNAFFLYVRCPDGHRLEGLKLRLSDHGSRS